MKPSFIISSLALLSTAIAAPQPASKGKHHYGDKGHHVDKGHYDDKEHYGGKHSWGHKKFTSTYNVIATPDQVVNATADGTGFYFTGGLKASNGRLLCLVKHRANSKQGALGYYNFGINSKTNTICYDITLTGFRGTYESAANTATHIHEGPYGETGPPRIAFPNPKAAGKNRRVSSGCLKGPFRTGVIDTETGRDTGAGFTVSEIEANPAGFFCDVHSSLAVPGAVRGQLA